MTTFIMALLMLRLSLYSIVSSLFASNGLTAVAQLTIQQGPVEVKKGDNATFWCKLKNDTAKVVPVNWQAPPDFKTRTGECKSYMAEKYKVNCSTDENLDNFYNLTVTNIEWSDNGTYRCMYTQHKALISLNVLVPVSQLNMTSTSSPDVTSGTLILRNGTTAVITCETDCASPEPNITVAGSEQHINTSSSHLEPCSGKQQGLTRAVTKITVLGRYVDDRSKNYTITCSAQNIESEPSVSESIEVNINVPSTEVTLTHGLNKTDESLLLKDGSKLVLTCKTNCASPVPRISWTENDQPYNSSGTITESECLGQPGLVRVTSTIVIEAQYKDEQSNNVTFTCLADNHALGPNISKSLAISYFVPVTDVKLTGPSGKSSRKSSDIIYLRNGTETILTCRTNCAFPTPTVSWTEDNVAFNGSTTNNQTVCPNTKQNLMRTVSTVTVDGIFKNREDTNSTISCTAENVEGVARRSSPMLVVRYVSVTQVVLRRPTNWTADLETVKNGTVVVLTCETECASPPPRVTWLRNEVVYSTNATLNQSECEGSQEGLTRVVSELIVDDQTDVAGVITISCRAENVVVEKPAVSQSVSFRYHVPVSELTLSYSLLFDKDVQSSFLVRNGKRFTVHCKTACASRPLPTINWTKNSQHYIYQSSTTMRPCLGPHERGLVKATSFIEVEAVYTGEENNTFTCLAEHGDNKTAISKSISLRYYVPVTELTLTYWNEFWNKKVPDTLNVTKDTNLLLTCRTNCASTKQNIHWIRNGISYPAENVTYTNCTGSQRGLTETFSTTYLDKGLNQISCSLDDVALFDGVSFAERCDSKPIAVKYYDRPKVVAAGVPWYHWAIGVASGCLFTFLCIVAVIVICHVRRKRKKQEVSQGPPDEVPIEEMDRDNRSEAPNPVTIDLNESSPSGSPGELHSFPKFL